MNIRPEALRQAYLDACEAELRAFKPGNVSVYSEGHDMTVADFRDSAKASATPLCDPALTLGEKVFHAIRATRQAVGCNTNLGIVLLTAPLMQACLSGKPQNTLRENLKIVLGNTTREDADWVYQAIRLASPGGLGESAEQDVHSAPDVTLLEAMQIAAGRDRIAFQYTSGYADVFEFAIPEYYTMRLNGLDEQWAVVAVFAGLLKTIPDSHIERKHGPRFTPDVAEKMALVGQALAEADSPELTLPLLREVDTALKAAGINPGTTADLTVACLVAVRLERLLQTGGQAAS